MNTRTKLVALTALASALAAGAWLGTHRPSAAPRTPASVAVPTPSATPAQAPALPDRRWTPGESFVYEVVAAHAVSTGQKGQGFDATLTAKLAVTVAARDERGVTLRAELRDPRFSSPAPASPSLSAPFYIAARATGEIVSFSFAKDTPTETVGVLKGLMASLQIVSPGAPLAAWRTTERDATGEYEAVYRRTAAGIHKSKHAYLRAHGLTGLGPLPGVYTVQSSIDMDIDASGWPRTLAEDESIDIDVAAARFASTSRTRAKLVTIEMRPDLAGMPDTSGLESDAETAAAGFARARANADKNLVAGRKFKDITAAFHAPEVQKRNDAMIAMGALFRQDPRATTEAREAVLHGKLDTEGVARTTAALGAAGTPEAQRALGEIIASPDADSTKAVQAVVALGQSEHQIPDNEAVLRKAMGSGTDEVAGAAALALGSSVRTRNAEQSGDTEKAVQALTGDLANAPSTEATRVYLLALGNSGDPRALPAIEPYLSNPNVDLRIAAVTALRRIPGDQADDDILAAMQDSAYLVRRAAVDTIAFREGARLVKAAEERLHTDPEESVRIAILTVLYPKHEAEPSVIEAIAWAAESDPARKVREAAKRFLDLEG